MNKRTAAVIVALTLSCFNFGDRKPVGAQPLEIEMAVHVPGPPIIVQKPLELSLDHRLAAQQIIWECRMREKIQEHGRTHRATDSDSTRSNPLPCVSSALSDAFAFLNQI